MGSRRSTPVPPGAFAYYAALGSSRSAAAVAARFHVSVRAIEQAIASESWDAKVAEIARRTTFDPADEMNDRHVKELKIVQAKALEALRSMAIKTASEAAHALIAAVREERAIYWRWRRRR